MQYTLQDIPPRLDAALQSRAKKEGKSLNQVIIETLLQSFGLARCKDSKRDIRFLVGSWDVEPEVEKFLEEQRRISSL